MKNNVSGHSKYVHRTARERFLIATTCVCLTLTEFTFPKKKKTPPRTTLATWTRQFQFTINEGAIARTISLATGKPTACSVCEPVATTFSYTTGTNRRHRRHPMYTRTRNTIRGVVKRTGRKTNLIIRVTRYRVQNRKTPRIKRKIVR